MASGNLSESICAKLSERILRWDYLPGHRLTEEGLCAEFAVSRSPVREALNTLVENGLVEKRPRVGYHVKLLDFEEIDELYEVRLALEEYVVARLCLQGMDTKRIDELIAYWTDLQRRLPDTAALVPASDEKFHETLVSFARNGALSKAIKDIDRRIHFVRLADITSPERVKSTCSEHLELLAAIRDKNSARALDALRRNIDGGRSSVELAIKEALARAYRRRD
jgi:DNA-binding GntR family transcriptional regulator